MSRWGSIGSLADIERRIRQGRGSGKGESYRPWISVREFSSRGRSHIVPGIKVRRDHHLFSDLEASVFLAAEFHPAVQDIQEQYPLLPYGVTREIAVTAGIRHPRYPRTNVDTVMTSDFVLTVSGGTDDPDRLIVSVKYVSDLKKPRALEKLEIERRYWSAARRPWVIITDRDIPRDLSINLRWLRQGAILPAHLLDHALKESFLVALAAQRRPNQPLAAIIQRATRKLALAESDAVGLFKHLAWHHQIIMDLGPRLSLARPVADLQVMPAAPAAHLMGRCSLWSCLSTMS